MSGKFENKVMVVTGGTSGIGLATAKHFAAEGASVFITGRRQEELDAAVKPIGGQVSGVRADISKLADIDRLYDAVQQKHSQIDVLATNAGGGSMLPLGAIAEEQYEDTFGRNVKGVIFTVQKALPLLRYGAAPAGSEPMDRLAEKSGLATKTRRLDPSRRIVSDSSGS
jgi:NAD(P)-dependent dehydrogenase (short-subunit alcohol dehydrogenase family)